MDIPGLHPSKQWSVPATPTNQRPHDELALKQKKVSGATEYTDTNDNVAKVAPRGAAAEQLDSSTHTCKRDHAGADVEPLKGVLQRHSMGGGTTYPGASDDAFIYGVAICRHYKEARCLVLYHSIDSGHLRLSRPARQHHVLAFLEPAIRLLVRSRSVSMRQTC